jgi:FkbM family methyltransferase
MKNSFIQMQGALRKFILWQRRFATSIYKLAYSAKVLPAHKYRKGASEKAIADRRLYKTKYGDKFWLNKTSYIDKNIRDFSIWEPVSTKIVKNVVKPGDIVLDIGANIGYYTVIMSKIVGEQGKVLAFEPTKHFGEVLKENIKVNNLENVTVYEYGLSDKDTNSNIFIGDNSATIHWAENKGNLINNETIPLKTLDSMIDSLKIEKINFIKIDVDGHEPFFLKGAWKTISKYKPKILLEIDHAHYLKAGFTAWDFYNEIKDRGFHIYSEKNMSEYPSLDSFLFECGNFDHGMNVLIIP